MTRYTQSMRAALEEVWANDIQIDEGKMKTIATLFDQGKSAEDIAKKMKLPLATIKTILGEEDIKEDNLLEFTDAQIAKLKKEYSGLAGKRISLARANQLRNIFDRIADVQLPKLFKADIPFISAMAVSRMIQKGIKVPKGVKLTAFENKSWDQVISEYTEYVEYMAKNSGEASKIASMFKGKTGGGEISKSGSEVRIDSAKDVEAIHNTVMKNFPDTRILTKEDDELKEGTGTIKGFRDDKEKSNMISLAKQHGLKVSDVAGGIQLKGNMRKILDMQLAAGSHLKTESLDEAVLAGRDYKYTGKGPVEISKANFKKISKDFKKTTPGQEMMVVLDPKTHGTVLAPVKFTEETENGEVDSGKIKLKDLMGKKEDKKEDNKEKTKDTIDGLKDQIHMLKTKLENEKNKAIKPEPNPDTGEVPLQVGIAHKILRDKEKAETKKKSVDEGFASDAQRKAAFANGYKEKGKDKKEDTDLTKDQIKQVHKMADELPKKKFKDAYGKKGDSVRYGTATNMVKKKLNIENKDHPAKMKYEQIEGLKKKAEKSGMPYGILKKVYDRGMAAWKGGHRPGASQHQWAFARVNSFITKSSGTWGGADKDLAAKVKGK